MIATPPAPRALELGAIKRRWSLAMLNFTPNDERYLGLIPTFLSEDDPRPAREQFAENYAFGGGWSPMPNWKLDENTRRLQYPGDPAMRPRGIAHLRSETIIVYESAWVAIVQANGDFEVARMD